MLDALESGVVAVADQLLETIDLTRLDASRRLDKTRRGEMGQFLTPSPIAHFMASMFEAWPSEIRLLDPGAGIGSLSAAFVAEACRTARRPKKLSLSAYETDPILIEYLRETVAACDQLCRNAGIEFRGSVITEDFVESGVRLLTGGTLFLGRTSESYNCAILNPPYRKIRSDSRERHLLRSIGMETSNLYTAFLSVALELLDSGGELVAITPRSFCNGPYFKPFRQMLLRSSVLRRIHVFETRDTAFGEDDVLQENVIIHGVKGGPAGSEVTVSVSAEPDDLQPMIRQVPYNEVVLPGDPDCFIHIAADDLDRRVAEEMGRFTATLEMLGIAVSTGRVVDFRAKDYLRSRPEKQTVPLIYPGDFASGFVSWPRPESKKPNALLISPETSTLLVPSETYVLVKRFSAKEEPRRVVAAIYDPRRVAASGSVGFENHLNYYHRNGGGLPPDLAKGLAIFLNSTLVDLFFRQFSGHTQVNATDLRRFKYPTVEELEQLGAQVGESFPGQDEIDRLVREELTDMADGSIDPVRAKGRIEEATNALKDLGFPREQLNDRSALTLLALLDLKPEMSWTDASSPLRGIAQMMDFFSSAYEKRYAPNTRETVRRFTVHQFVQAGLVLQNPDKSSRPTNSPQNVYQITPAALALLQSYKTEEWIPSLRTYLTSVESLTKRYARERKMRRIPVRIASKTTIKLSPGGQNVLVKQILDEFCSHFTPGAAVYVGDAQKKEAYVNKALLANLGVSVDEHGKMPDVVVYHEEKNWLVLIEAVTSHGPVNPKRRLELRELFAASKVPLVFVTAFLDRKTMVRYLGDIAWETEVWIAESPTHLVHFNGERFLGPYEETP